MLWLGTQQVFGLAGDLKTPGVALSTTLSTNIQAQIQAVLERPDCKFLGGQFINFSTTLRYESETAALSLFLEELAKCPETSLTISFSKEFLEECDWEVQHRPNHFHIRVNLNSTRMDLEKLALPIITGPAAKVEVVAP